MHFVLVLFCRCCLCSQEVALCRTPSDNKTKSNEEPPAAQPDGDAAAGDGKTEGEEGKEGVNLGLSGALTADTNTFQVRLDRICKMQVKIHHSSPFDNFSYICSCSYIVPRIFPD